MEETRTVSLTLPLATVYEQAKTRLRTESVAVGIALVAEGGCLVDEDSICATEESSSSMVGVLQGALVDEEKARTTPRSSTITFYSQRFAYGEFSNFSEHPFRLDDERWPTSEHYFQAQKFVGTGMYELIRKAKSPSIAAQLGRSRKVKLRPDWENVKDDVMRTAVSAKFGAHPELRELLLRTGDAMLVEKTKSDYYWGCGSSGTGKNRLGQVLMELRAHLRSRPDARS